MLDQPILAAMVALYSETMRASCVAVTVSEGELRHFLDLTRRHDGL